MVASYKDYKRQIADLEKKAAEARLAESVKVIDSIKAQIAEYELTPADLFEGVKVDAKVKAKARTTASVNPPKYMDPKSGKTWTGFGKAPAWILGAIKNGKKDNYLISVVTAAKAEKEKAKAEAEAIKSGKPASVKAVKTVKTSVATQPNAKVSVKASAATQPTPKKPVKAKTPASPKRVPASVKPAAQTAPADTHATDVVAVPATEASNVQSGS